MGEDWVFVVEILNSNNQRDWWNVVFEDSILGVLWKLKKQAKCEETTNK